jgi:hypothetical protein
MSFSAARQKIKPTRHFLLRDGPRSVHWPCGTGAPAGGFPLLAPRALGSLLIAQETRSAPESQQFQDEKDRDADYKRSAPIARRNTEDVVQARAQEMLVDISAECESKEDEENRSRHSIEEFPPGNQNQDMQSG